MFLEDWALPKKDAQRSFHFDAIHIYIYKLNFGQNIGDKSVVLLRTWWEHFGDSKRSLPPSSQNPKEINRALLHAHVQPSHWPHEKYGCRTICHHLQPGLIPLPNSMGRV
jgi:hypothetical protein